MAQGRGKGDVGVCGMNDDLADLTFLFPDMGPVLAGVGGFVDAVAGGHVAANVSLSRADVDDVRIGGRHGDGADRGNRLLVENRLPGEAAIAAFPDAAGRRGRVVSQRIAGDSRRAADATAGRGTNRPVLDELEFGRSALIRL